MVIFEVGFQNLRQLPFIEKDHSVQARRIEPTRRSTNGFCQGDLGAINFCSMPIASRRRTKDRSADRISVPQQILGRRVVGEGIDDLLGSPRRRWSMGQVEMNDFAPIMIHDDQYVEESQCRGGNHEKIHCCESAGMVLEESLPTL